MKNRIKLGIFFIVTIVLFVFAVTVFGKFKVKGNGYRIYVDYSFIGDLNINGKVSYRGGGIKIGFIDDITINPDGTIRVSLFITDKNVVLPEGTRFSIATVGLGLGEKYILASPPTEITSGLKRIPPNSIVQGVEPFSLESTLGSIGDVGKGLNLSELGGAITNLTEVVSIINGLVADNELEINDVIYNLQHTVSNVSIISGHLANIIQDVDNGNGTIGVALKDESVKTNIVTIISNLTIFSAKVKENPSILLFRESRENR